MSLYTYEEICCICVLARWHKCEYCEAKGKPLTFCHCHINEVPDFLKGTCNKLMAGG